MGDGKGEGTGAKTRRRRRSPGGGPLLLAAIALAAWTILVGVTVLGALASPGSGAAGVAARLLPIPDVAGYRALKAQQAQPGAPPDYAAAAHAYRDELATAPVKTDAWLGLAYAESRRAGGHYTPATLAALDRSYAFAPFDGSVFTWRSGFALGGWDVLTPELRRAVVDEMSAVWTARPDLQPQIRAEVQAMPSPTGRQAVQAALDRLGPRR